MKRVRVSTTVDGGRLAACRRLLRTSDSRLLDRALQALINELEAAAEIRALEEFPYDGDPELASIVSDAPVLPYDGDVPKEVLLRAKARRRRR